MSPDAQRILGFPGQGRVLDKTLVMGVLNVTPDSFSDGGDFTGVEAAVAHAISMQEAGADIIDVGGESTRPGADSVTVAQELERVLPVIENLSKRIRIPISIDTTQPEVMRAAIDAGAGMINDVNALRTPGAMQVAAGANVPVCLMHMQGRPRFMQEQPEYTDVVAEVHAFLRERVEHCIDAGISREHIVVDPGFGFGKALAHNLQLLRGLQHFSDLAQAVLVGVSRKSMIGQLTGRDLGERLAGSIAAASYAAMNGADIVRVHDVVQTVDAMRVIDSLQGAGRLNVDDGAL